MSGGDEAEEEDDLRCGNSYHVCMYVYVCMYVCIQDRVHPIVQSPRAARAQGADEVRSTTTQVHSFQRERLVGRDANGFVATFLIFMVAYVCMYVCMYVFMCGC